MIGCTDTNINKEMRRHWNRIRLSDNFQ